ncbi:MAG: sigma-70 family RNA polymerase sigma factor [Actinobacteria bacterium]|nr:MAG: sigma-70 family RNA polymerase sigma factor [Actinomycetota bacterium]
MDQRIPQDPGDERADVFAELYEAHYRPLVALCRRLTGPRDAEELAQEAFLRAWSSWERYAPTRPFWPWVSTIGRRLCIDHGRRRQTAQLRGPYVLDGHRSPPTPEELVELGEEYRWARAALAELRPDQRRVIRLRDVEGWSYDRIASHEGVTVESVRGSLRRARSRLRLVYARMSSTSSVIVLLGLLRSARRRLSEVSHRIQSNAASAGVLSGRAADAVAALVVLAMGTVPTAVTAASVRARRSSPGQRCGDGDDGGEHDHYIRVATGDEGRCFRSRRGRRRHPKEPGGQRRRHRRPPGWAHRPRQRRHHTRVGQLHVLHPVPRLPARPRGVRQRPGVRRLCRALPVALPFNRRGRPLGSSRRPRVRRRHGDAAAGLPGRPSHLRGRAPRTEGVD